MKTTGIVRAVDKMGRVVIPKEIRQKLDIKNDVDSFEIFMEGDSVILKKYQPTCIFCDSLSSLVDFEGHNICLNCIDKLGLLKEQSE